LPETSLGRPVAWIDIRVKPPGEPPVRALDFRFAGTVLETREVSVEGVRVKGSKSFRVELTDKPGVAAFRYARFPS